MEQTSCTHSSTQDSTCLPFLAGLSKIERRHESSNTSLLELEARADFPDEGFLNELANDNDWHGLLESFAPKFSSLLQWIHSNDQVRYCININTPIQYIQLSHLPHLRYVSQRRHQTNPICRDSYSTCDHPETLSKACGPDSKSPYLAWLYSIFQLLHVSKSTVSSDKQPNFPTTSSDTILWNTIWIAQIIWDIQNRTLSLKPNRLPGMTYVKSSTIYFHRNHGRLWRTMRISSDSKAIY